MSRTILILLASAALLAVPQPASAQSAPPWPASDEIGRIPGRPVSAAASARASAVPPRISTRTAPTSSSGPLLGHARSR